MDDPELKLVAVFCVCVCVCVSCFNFREGKEWFDSHREKSPSGMHMDEMFLHTP